MKHTDLTRCAIGRPLAFGFAGWIMLAVIMVFATAGGGQAQSRLIGSAFDPFTTAVSLSPKQRPLVAKPAVFENGVPDDATGNLPFATVAADLALTPAPALSFLPSRPVREVVADHSRHLAIPLGARAPPTR